MKIYQWLFLLLLMSACSQAQEAQPSIVLSTKQVDSLLNEVLVFPKQTQLSIGLIKNGVVSFVGLKNENGQALKVDSRDNIFEIGSITKVFTATLLAQMVLEGQLKLEDAIESYTTLSIQDNRKISFVQLANHTSGLPRLPSNISKGQSAENPYKHYGEIQLKSYLSNELSNSLEMEGTYLYSNLGTGLLGFVVSEIGQQSFESLLQSKIFSKYGMSNSTTNRTKVKSILVKGLNEAGQEVPNWDLSVLVGAGGILSSTADLSKFALAHFNNTNKDLALTRQPTHTINHISDIGLAWEIIKRRSGAIWYKHNGGTGGYTSSMILDVQQKNGIIILSNVSAYNRQSDLIDDWSFDLMKLMDKK